MKHPPGLLVMVGAVFAGACFCFAAISPVFIGPGVTALVLCAEFIVNKEDWE